MKADLYIEYEDTKVSYNQLVDMVKEAWREEGRLMKDLKVLELYYKPGERRCYYVINGEEKGSLGV